MSTDPTVVALQKSVRRLRLGFVVATIGLAALLLGGMQESGSAEKPDKVPTVVGVSTVSATLPAHTVLYRAWSNGLIERRVLQTDSGKRNTPWQAVQRP